MKNVCLLTLLFLLGVGATGCGTFMAHGIAQAPNRYPTWFAPAAPVTLAFNPKLLTNFIARYANVGPPPAKLRYRVVEPADYAFKISSTNWLEDDRKDYSFTFGATVPGPTNHWTASPRGTVFLLHGYALAQFSMLPWALQLSGDGWRCVLVDLRGHGKSTGNRVYFTVKEVSDMRQLLDHMTQAGQISGPVSVVGESMGAVLALRWKTVDPRITSVVAIAPYASLSNATMNIREEYAGWVPRWLVASGIEQLPCVLNIPADQFDPVNFMRAKPVSALFVAGELDKIAPPTEVRKLRDLALPDSPMILVPDATHESLTYYFSDLRAPAEAWLDGQKAIPQTKPQAALKN